jgi:competence protein ComEC
VTSVGLLPALSLLIGSLLGLSTAFDAWLPASILVPSGAGAIVLWLRRSERAAILLVALGFISAGAALAADARERALHSSIRHVLDREFGGFAIESMGPAGRHEPVISRLLLLEDAAPRDGYVSIRGSLIAVRVRHQWTTVEGGVAISVNGAVAADRVDHWRAGRTVQAAITFRRPARYLNDAVPDFEREQALGGTTLLGTIKSGLLVEVVEIGSFVSERCADLRRHVRRAIERWIAPHDAISAAIASAVLIGDRTSLPDETREALQVAGTYHVIAISGGNIAILAGAVTLLLLLVGIRGRHSAWVAIAVLSAYAFAVTAGPSVWRATLMAILYFCARTIDQRTGVWQTASVAAALMVVIAPLDVRDAGFILTFGATLALVEGSRVAASFTPQIGARRWIVASVLASLAIEIALLPVSATLFSRVTGAGLVLNLLAVPLMGVVQIAGLIVVLLADVTQVAGPAGIVAHLAAKALVNSAELVPFVPWSTARVSPPSGVVIVMYYGAVMVMFLWRARTARAISLVVWVAATLVITGIVDPHLVGPNGRARTLRLTMFDVGQGESVLIETPAGRRMLVDAGGMPFGGSFDIGARVLAPALWARGIRRLDTLLVTHGDPDHLGGAGDVLADFTPRDVWFGIPVPNHQPSDDLLEAATRLDIPVSLRRAGEIVTEDDIRIRVLHPPPPDWERRRVRNDDSVVIEIVYGDVAVLLTGDISAQVEREITPRLTHAPVRVLKVAHHGSRTSSSFDLLSAWHPQIALISAGRGNTFGHPAPEVLQRLATIGATVLRTDLHGQITMQTDGQQVNVSTFVESKNEPR